MQVIYYKDSAHCSDNCFAPISSGFYGNGTVIDLAVYNKGTVIDLTVYNKGTSAMLHVLLYLFDYFLINILFSMRKTILCVVWLENLVMCTKIPLL